MSSKCSTHPKLTEKIDEERAPIDVRNGFVHSQLDQIEESINLAAQAAIHDQAHKQKFAYLFGAKTDAGEAAAGNILD